MSTELVRLRLETVATQSLLLATEPQIGNRRSSALEISGTTLRGALAALWIGANGDPDERFDRLFGGSVRWPVLRPEHHVTVPLSVRRCKYRPKPECARTALDVFDPTTGRDGEAAGADEDTALSCPFCGGFLELAKGELVNAGPGRQVSRTSRTASALTDAETPAESQLFTRQGVPKGTRFTGTSVLGSHPDDATRSWIDQLVGTELRVGGRRSVNGALRIVDASISVEPVEQRIEPGQLVAIRLDSSAIVLDEFGAPTSHPGPLLAAFDPGGASFRLADASAGRSSSFLRPLQVTGWNALAGLPRYPETALCAGSTLICTAVRELTSAEVADLTRKGAGTRLEEGFGQVRIDIDPWHFPSSVHADSSATAADAATADDSDDSAPLGLIETAVAELSGSERDAHLAWVIDRLRTAAAAFRQQPDISRSTLVTDLKGLRSTRKINSRIASLVISAIEHEDVRWEQIERSVLRFERLRDNPSGGGA